VPLRLFLERIGADMTAKYVGFNCIDGYSGSIDMASALHAQTQLTNRYPGGYWEGRRYNWFSGI
jgi:DMSO/TMAO reductase YedYZ molybdopterin-dependent catalytic subunit